MIEPHPAPFDARHDPPPPSLYSVELRTAQWLTMLGWYRDALGARVCVRVMEDRFALLAFGEGRLALLGHDHEPPAPGRISLALETADLAAAAQRLTAHGAKFRPVRRHAEGYEDLVTHDPDGNQLRLFQWPQP